MFFIISKVLGYFLYPVVWLILLLALAIFLRNKAKRKRALVVAFLLLLVFTNSFLVNTIASTWDINPTKIDTCYDVGIVLGGGTITYDAYYNRNTFHETADRLLQAIQLYKKGIIKKILITGGSANLIYKQVKEANLMNSFLRTIDIPSSDILVDTLAENTHQNAVYSKQLLQQHPGYHKFLLITSSMHMRRARACFQKVGLTVTPYPTNLLDQNGRTNPEYLFMPDISNMLIWNGLMHEMIGYVAYKVKGYI